MFLFLVDFFAAFAVVIAAPSGSLVERLAVGSGSDAFIARMFTETGAIRSGDVRGRGNPLGLASGFFRPRQRRRWITSAARRVPSDSFGELHRDSAFPEVATPGCMVFRPRPCHKDSCIVL